MSVLQSRALRSAGAGLCALWLAAAATSAAAADSKSAANYPSRPVRVIVPFAPGGGADVIARLVFAKLQARLGQPFVIDNRGSAGGIVGTDAVAKAAPDGYTLLLGQTGPNAINPSLFNKMPYDPIRDFAPVIQLTAYPYVIVANPKVPVKSLKDLIDQSKAKPDSFTFGSAGTGSSGQLAGELFMRTVGIKMTHVPYKGAGPALSDTLAGNISLTFGDIAASTPLVRAGQLRALAVTGPKRTPLLADVPTVAESGYPGFDAQAWHAVYAPAGTPKPIIDKLNTELAAVLKDPEIQERFAKDGIEAVGKSPEDFARYTKEEVDKWGATVRAAGIKLDY
ncbi:tripartite tricarboxylate transporter substrate binding protein [Pigmentiphaga soli]|uniref:Tripartite tricarboxylate transporter substrate binding protein n=1 Tax=Pigmentiphaga soli TaxID=1007095 RepID=A0ABP8H2G9_9BURK